MHCAVTQDWPIPLISCSCMFFINILLRLSRFKEMTWIVKWVTKRQTGININSWHKLNFFLRITDLWHGIWGFGTVKDYFYKRYYYHYCSVTKLNLLVSYKSGYFYLYNWMFWCPISNIVQWKQSEGLTLNPFFYVSNMWLWAMQPEPLSSCIKWEW